MGGPFTHLPAWIKLLLNQPILQTIGVEMEAGVYHK